MKILDKGEARSPLGTSLYGFAQRMLGAVLSPRGASGRAPGSSVARRATANAVVSPSPIAPGHPDVMARLVRRSPWANALTDADLLRLEKEAEQALIQAHKSAARDVFGHVPTTGRPGEDAAAWGVVTTRFPGGVVLEVQGHTARSEGAAPPAHGPWQARPGGERRGRSGGEGAAALARSLPKIDALWAEAARQAQARQEAASSVADVSGRPSHDAR